MATLHQHPADKLLQRGWMEKCTGIYYLASLVNWVCEWQNNGGEVNVCVTCDVRKQGVSAQFDESSEPERRQPLRDAELSALRLESEMESKKRAVKVA